jgi:hypothetical protein
MIDKKELSPLAKRLLGNAGHIDVFTQTEFDEALVLAKAEIMQVAIETTKQAIFIERQACADIAAEMAKEWSDNPEAPMSIALALEACAGKILNRIPNQRQ